MQLDPAPLCALSAVLASGLTWLICRHRHRRIIKPLARNYARALADNLKLKRELQAAEATIEVTSGQYAVHQNRARFQAAGAGELLARSTVDGKAQIEAELFRDWRNGMYFCPVRQDDEGVAA